MTGATFGAISGNRHRAGQTDVARGIKDTVVMLGMGCSRFGERWDCGPEELMVEAFAEALGDAGIEKSRIDVGDAVFAQRVPLSGGIVIGDGAC